MLSPGLLITRPQPEADRLTQRLSSHAIPCWTLPALEIESVTPTVDSLEWARLAQYWIFISANAVREGWPHLSSLVTPLPHLVAVGTATAQRLASVSGLSILHPCDGSDSEALLRLPEFQQIDGQRITIIRGENGREHLHQILSARGARVTYVECYRRLCPKQLGPDYDEALRNKAWINIQSRETILNLWSLSSEDQRQTLRSLHFVVSHPNIATTLQQLGLVNITILTPGDDALVNHMAQQTRVLSHV